MRDYQPSTRKRLGDLENGLRVSTGTLLNTVYMDNAQQEIFTVVGRVMVLQLYCEAITIFAAVATTLLFNATFATPAVGVAPMTGASGVLTSLAQGNRVVYVGGGVGTATVITGGGGVSDVICANPQIIGSATITGVMGAGTIGVLTAGGAQTSGTCQFTIHYASMEEGSYITTAL